MPAFLQIVGAGRIAIFVIHLPQNQRLICTSDRTVDRAGGICLSLCDGKIGAVDRSFFHLVGKNGTAQHMFGEDQKPGGVAVQPVDAAEYKRDILPVKVPGSCICKGVFIIADGRVYRHIRRFINDHQIFVFVDNMNR